MNTPVVLVFYNRPSHVREVFSAIARVQPRQLFLVADGPRDAEDRRLCDAARDVVAKVGWPCDVQRNYSDTNLGVDKRLPSGLDWVFSLVEEAIILEDDCVPSDSFFRFAGELLTRYRDDERVMEIAGGNYQSGKKRTEYSYYFSRYWGVWGWATWRRAWAHFEGNIRSWPALRENGLLESALPDAVEREYWRYRFDRLYRGDVSPSWDWQWLFAMWAQNGLSVVPEVNLISNIGYGPEATSTRSTTGSVANLPRGEITGELRHPPSVFPNMDADRYIFDHALSARRLRLVPAPVRRLGRRAQTILRQLRRG